MKWLWMRSQLKTSAHSWDQFNFYSCRTKETLWTIFRVVLAIFRVGCIALQQFLSKLHDYWFTPKFHPNEWTYFEYFYWFSLELRSLSITMLEIPWKQVLKWVRLLKFSRKIAFASDAFAWRIRTLYEPFLFISHEAKLFMLVQSLFWYSWCLSLDLEWCCTRYS